MATYSEKLKDPRWQKVRLKIFERDKFTCVLCEDDKETLHVHHEYYSNCQPWEAPLNSLKTLCKHCHLLVENTKEAYPGYILKEVRKTKSTTGKIFFVVFYTSDIGNCVLFCSCEDDSIGFLLDITDEFLESLYEKFNTFKIKNA